MEKISYINLKELNVGEEAITKQVSGEYLEKISREIKDFNLILKVTKHMKSQKANYSLHARLNAPSVLISAESDDWDLRKALHEVFTSLINELEHKFKTKGKRWKLNRQY